MRRDWSPDEIITAVRSAGTLDYVAPEQIKDRARSTDARTWLAGLRRVRAAVRHGAIRARPGLDDIAHTALRASTPGCPARRPDLPTANPTWSWPRRLRRTRQTVMRPEPVRRRTTHGAGARFPASQITRNGCARRGHAVGRIAESRLASATSDLPDSTISSTSPPRPRRLCSLGPVKPPSPEGPAFRRTGPGEP